MWDLLSMKAKSTIVALFTAIFVLAYPLLNIGFPDVKYEIATVNSISKFVSLLTGYWTFIYLFFRFFGMSLWSMPGISRILNKYVGPDLRGGGLLTSNSKELMVSRNLKYLDLKLPCRFFTLQCL